MKKIISLLLSTIIFIGVAGSGFAALAAEPTKIDIGQTISGETKEYCVYYQFTVPASGTVILDLSGNTYYRGSSKYGVRYSLYDSVYSISSDESIHFGSAAYNEAFGTGMGKFSLNLMKGTYYLKLATYYDSYGFEYFSYNFNLTYKPNISTPSSLKVSTCNTTSLKLNWGKVGGVSGYQLQRKSGDKWNTITNTTSNSYTAKSLKAGTTYNFRVRAYKTIDGQKYYSAWKTITTPTKPSKPSIKSPSTNKKHQIIVKWNKVSNCSGYQVQYSKKKNFSSVIATKTVSGKSKTSYTGKNFTKGRKYYVRVRSYKTVDGKKYYSSWSSVKSIKCK